MSFVANPPPSLMARKIKEEMQETGDGEDGPKKQSREDWKKMKELEEARKAGTAPAMKDEEGKDINPHIPQYIMQAPWYFGSEQPTLRHQRQQDEKQTSFARMDDWYKRGVKDGPVVSKFRKGACENCGAMTHKKKDCLERPRKIGARFTGSDIAPDEHIQLQLSHDFDGKRDRWNGYDAEEHQQKLQDDYLKMEEAKRILKEASLDTKLNSTEEMDDKADRDSDDEKYAEEMDMPGQKFETKQRITVRNLRIREDTAKYLFNLDVNSAFYDPKTRSMRENPFKSTGKEASELETKFAGDNFVRVSGNAMDMANTQVFAWEAYERGVDVHLQADPTKLELLKKEFHSRQDTYKDTVRSSILDKYGGEEYLKSELPVAQSESYVEYSRHGTVIKGQEKAAVKSRYEEDVYPNNHTSVWGSYWRDGKWGYRCCHSLVKESYCTGEAGKEVYDEDIPLAITETAANPEEMGEPQFLLEQHKNKLEEKKKSKNKKKKDKKRRKKKKRRHSSSSDSSSDDSDSDSDSEERKRKRLKKALKEEERHRAEVDKLMALDERKRPYNSMYEARAPTEEEMEAFRIKQMHPEDPMAHFNP